MIAHNCAHWFTWSPLIAHVVWEKKSKLETVGGGAIPLATIVKLVS